MSLQMCFPYPCKEHNLLLQPISPPTMTFCPPPASVEGKPWSHLSASLWRHATRLFHQRESSKQKEGVMSSQGAVPMEMESGQSITRTEDAERQDNPPHMCDLHCNLLGQSWYLLFRQGKPLYNHVDFLRQSQSHAEKIATYLLHVLII